MRCTTVPEAASPNGRPVHMTPNLVGVGALYGCTSSDGTHRSDFENRASSTFQVCCLS